MDYRLTEFQYWPQAITLLMIILAFSGYRYFAWHDTRSNDAYVYAHTINVAPLVKGPVTALYVKDNQWVKKGDKLLTIDPKPYDYAMKKALADYNLAKVAYNNNKLAITIAKEQLNEAHSVLALSQDHLKRYQSLSNKGDMPKIELININAKINEQKAAVIAAQEKVRVAAMNFDDNKVNAALASYHEAIYLYNNTTLVAAANGYVTNVNLRIGQYVRVGERLFALVETAKWWIITRYRETAIRLIKPGDKANITIDMYPGKVFHGHVVSIGWGINRVQAGNVIPSALVYLNATEDWIKIAQRFPVRIAIDDLSSDFPLRIGASATTVTWR